MILQAHSVGLLVTVILNLGILSIKGVKIHNAVDYLSSIRSITCYDFHYPICDSRSGCCDYKLELTLKKCQGIKKLKSTFDIINDGDCTFEYSNN